MPDAELDDYLAVVREATGAGVFEVGITPSVANMLRELMAAFRAATGGRSVHALRFTRQAKERGSIRLGSVAADAHQEKTA